MKRKRNPGAASPIAQQLPHSAALHAGYGSFFTAMMVKNFRFSLTNVPASFQSTCVPPRSEASSGDIQRAEAGAAPAGGLTNRTRATAGHYDPDAVGAAAVERRKASAR